MATKRRTKILGTGVYLPRKEVSAEELSKKLPVSPEWILKQSGVHTRYFASEDETASKMGAMAAREALQNAHVDLSEIDVIISTSGTPEMLIPCTAALIHKELQCNHSNIPAFDINSTCLSFVTGLDLISHMIDAKKYRKVLLISSEIASVGIDWSDPESATLFGDGAAAVVLGYPDKEEPSAILGSHAETHSDSSHLCIIEGGGTRLHAKHHSEETKKQYLFQMDGRGVFRKASQEIKRFVGKLLTEASISFEDVALYIPHQASRMALGIIKKKLAIEDAKWMQIVENHGNVIAASIPMALHQAIQQKRIKRGDKVALFGTSAGLSIGGVVFEY